MLPTTSAQRVQAEQPRGSSTLRPCWAAAQSLPGRGAGNPQMPLPSRVRTLRPPSPLSTTFLRAAHRSSPFARGLWKPTDTRTRLILGWTLSPAGLSRPAFPPLAHAHVRSSPSLSPVPLQPLSCPPASTSSIPFLCIPFPSLPLPSLHLSSPPSSPCFPPSSSVSAVTHKGTLRGIPKRKRRACGPLSSPSPSLIPRSFLRVTPPPAPCLPALLTPNNPGASWRHQLNYKSRGL